MPATAKIRTCIWIEEDAPGAARAYTALVPGSRILNEQAMEHMLTGEPDGVRLIEIEIGGTPFVLMEAGPHQPPTDRLSISVMTEDQAETDRIWSALTRDGGTEMPCGWLRDRWGVAWQITPRRIADLIAGGDAPRVAAMMRAMLTMTRLEIAALEAAHEAA